MHLVFVPKHYNSLQPTQNTTADIAGISPQLLFEWAMPVLSGTANAAGWSGVSIGVQCWVLVALKEGLAAVDTPTLNQHSHVVLTSCLHRLRSEATSVHLVAPMLGLISEVSACQMCMPVCTLGVLLTQQQMGFVLCDAHKCNNCLFVSSAYTYIVVECMLAQVVKLVFLLKGCKLSLFINKRNMQVPDCSSSHKALQMLTGSSPSGIPTRQLPGAGGLDGVLVARAQVA